MRKKAFITGFLALRAGSPACFKCEEEASLGGKGFYRVGKRLKALLNIRHEEINNNLTVFMVAAVER
jgi:hypothetical protein